MYIDRYAYINKLSSTHPGEKFAFALLSMSLCLTAGTPVVPAVVALLMSGVIIFRAGIPWLFYVKMLTLPAAFLFVGIITVALTISRVPAEGILAGFNVWGFTVGVTHGGLITAAGMFIKSLGAVSCLYFLSLTTPMVDLLWVLKKLRVPALLVEMMALIYRFIFVLMETAGRIYLSQQSRLGYRTYRLSFRSLGGLVSNLFLKSYQRSQALYTALSARCYGSELNVLEQDYCMSGKNIILIAAVQIFLLLLIIYGGEGIRWNI